MRLFIIGLALAALGCAFAMMLTLDALGMFGPAHRWVQLAAMCLWLSVLPVTLILCSRRAPFKSVNGLAVLMAISTAITIIADFMGRSGQGWFGDGLLLGPSFSAAYLVICGTVIGASIVGHGLRCLPPIVLYALVLGGLILGWYMAMEKWSRAMPLLMAADARQVADTRPYCIETSRRPVQRLTDLRGFSAWSAGERGVRWSFHAVLKLSQGREVRYFNWSHRSRGFQPVSKHARESLHLDQSQRCRPERGFADRLPE